MFEALTREVLIKNPSKTVQNPVGTILNESTQDKKKKKNDCCK